MLPLLDAQLTEAARVRIQFDNPQTELRRSQFGRGL